MGQVATPVPTGAGGRFSWVKTLFTRSAARSGPSIQSDARVVQPKDIKVAGKNLSSEPSPVRLGQACVEHIEEITVNLSHGIEGHVHPESIDPRPIWQIAAVEGVASAAEVINAYTIRSRGFNVAVSTGNVLGMAGVLAGASVPLSYVPLVVGVSLAWAAKGIERARHRPQGVEVMMSVLNGDLTISEPKPEESTNPEEEEGKGGKQTPVGANSGNLDKDASKPRCEVKVSREKKFFSAKPKRRGRISVAAGEVASLLKMRHGGLKDSPENRLLIRLDAGKRVEALRREDQHPFGSMRNTDALCCTMHAAEMYWILSSDEEYTEELYSHHLIKRLKRRRDKWVSSMYSSE